MGNNNMSKKKQGGPFITQMNDGLICTLQHWTDGTSSLEITTLIKKDGKVVPTTEIHEWDTPKQKENIEDYKLSMESGKIEAVIK
jgi:hypothetical protein|tara:strand:- start:280 stop:534 length:255 start_codon:yes stop_codon:yes gene_type:complete